MPRTKAPPARAQAAAADSTPPMKSLRSAMRLLGEFMGSQPDYGVGELATACQLSKSQVSKVLDVFAEFGFLRQDPATRRYSVGMRGHVLGTRFVAHDKLCQAALPLMRQVLDETGHSVRLTVLDDDEALYLLGIEGPLLSEAGWTAGNWLPIHATTAGRVLLAFMPEEHGKRLLGRPLKKFTERGVTDRKAIDALVASARSTGYSVQRDEIALGLGNLSVPVFGPQSRVVAALGIAFPAHTIAPEAEPEYVEALHNIARTFSHRLGCAAYPFGGASRAPVLAGFSLMARKAHASTIERT